MIPPFDGRGLLPSPLRDQGCTCTPGEVRQRFVLDLGSPPWRVRLYDRWDDLRRIIAETVPTASWWIWGCFVSNHPEPLYGERQDLSTLVMLPADDLPSIGQGMLLLHGLQAAGSRLHIDVAGVITFPPGHPEQMESLDQLEFKWRPRALSNVADHSTQDLVPAGFLEVMP